jgi:hypothetical protein
MTSTLDSICSSARVIVACGTGGVGKTSVAAALGVPISSANRPSDTIFGNPTPFAKPLIGLAGPLAQRNTGIINPKKAYYIKPAPAPYQVVNQIKKLLFIFHLFHIFSFFFFGSIN